MVLFVVLIGGEGENSVSAALCLSALSSEYSVRKAGCGTTRLRRTGARCSRKGGGPGCAVLQQGQEHGRRSESVPGTLTAAAAADRTAVEQRMEEGRVHVRRLRAQCTCEREDHCVRRRVKGEGRGCVSRVPSGTAQGCATQRTAARGRTFLLRSGQLGVLKSELG